ncbi:MAG: hypothetical protein Kow0077_01140 [Anaerolineae bacterium]
MNEAMRFATTAVIWLAYAGTVIAALLSGTRVTDWVIAVIVVVFGLLAGYATRKIWMAGAEVPPAAEKGHFSAAKPKRDQVERALHLLDTLDDDEIIELETLMASRPEDAAFLQETE